MIWGLGTGRCGTKSLAVALGGLHEPKPKINDLAVDYARQGGAVDERTRGYAELEDRLKQRMDLAREKGAPIIVDLQNSYVLPLIRLVDPDAAFVVMFRNPFDTIASFMLGGAFTKRDGYGQHKLMPAEGWPGQQSRIHRVSYHWRQTNNTILQFLDVYDPKYAMRRPHQLPVHANKYPKQGFVFTRLEAVQILYFCGPVWARLLDLYRGQADGWLVTMGLPLI